MGVLLGLRRLEHRLPRIGHHLGDDVLHRLGGKGDRYVERAVVRRHRHEMHARSRRNIKPVEIAFDQRAHDLPHSISAEIEADDDVAIAHGSDGAIIANDDRGLHKLVGDISLVRRTDNSERISGRGPNAEHCASIPFLRSVPSLVSIHSEVASGNARDHRSSGGAIPQLSHVAEPGSRHCVAPVEQRVDSDTRRLLTRTQVDQRE